MIAGIPELVIVLVLVAIFFGAGKLPAVMEAMGHGLKQFRDARGDDEATPKS